MAGEIAHIVYAARLLTHIKDKVSHPSYWVGTVFPDIYRIGRISRFPTHTRPVSLSALIGSNDFTTGMRVHSWIDATHELYFKENATFEKLPWHPLLPFAFELFEDEVLYSSYQDWNLIIRALGQIDPDEERIIHNRPHIQAWHALLQTYFRNAPTDESRIEYMKKLQLSTHSAKEINSIISDLRAHTHAKEMLMDYIKTIEHILI